LALHPAADQLTLQALSETDKSWIFHEHGKWDWRGPNPRNCSEESHQTLEWLAIEVTVLKLPESAQNSPKSYFAQWNVWGAAHETRIMRYRKFKVISTFHLISGLRFCELSHLIMQSHQEHYRSRSSLRESVKR
jgi:hypothetical protein